MLVICEECQKKDLEIERLKQDNSILTDISVLNNNEVVALRRELQQLRRIVRTDTFKCTDEYIKGQ